MAEDLARFARSQLSWEFLNDRSEMRRRLSCSFVVEVYQSLSPASSTR